MQYKKTLPIVVILIAFLSSPVSAFSVPVDFHLSLTELGITHYPDLYEWNGFAANPFFMEPAIRDLDGDGDSDVVIAFGTFAQNKEDEIFYHPVILENLGNGTLRRVAIHAQVVGQSNPREIAFADFNLDGIKDVVIIGHGYDAPDAGTAGFGDQNILLFSKTDGTYTDVSYLLPQEAAFTHSVTVGDVNSDGYPDIYIGNLSHSVHLLLNNQGAGFYEVVLPDSIFNFFRYWPLPAVKYTSSLLVDIDNDGVLELVLGATGQDGPPGISIVVDQDGQGNFDASPKTHLPVGLFGLGTITVDVDAADINGDGLKDLLLSQTPSNPFYQGRGLQFLIQNPDGTFADHTGAIIGLDHAGVWLKGAAFSDADGDGDLDILVEYSHGAYTPTNASVILYNFGLGQFIHSPSHGYATNSHQNYQGGFIGAFDKDSGSYFAFVDDFTNYVINGINAGMAVLWITRLEIAHP